MERMSALLAGTYTKAFPNTGFQRLENISGTITKSTLSATLRVTFPATENELFNL